MNVIQQILNNQIFMAGICSWLVAQVLKTLIDAIVNKGIDWHRMVGDGGMPSCHSATVTAVALAAGVKNGFDSPVFAVACILAIIVMHDAMGVRLETGRQAKIINQMVQLFQDLGQPQISMEKKLKELVGHTPLQVAAGFLLGIVVGLLYCFA